MCQLLAIARELTTYTEVLPWMHPSDDPEVLQALQMCNRKCARAHGP